MKTIVMLIPTSRNPIIDQSSAVRAENFRIEHFAGDSTISWVILYYQHLKSYPFTNMSLTGRSHYLTGD